MLLAPAAAQAHPLGNFTVNRLAVVGVSGDRVDVRWILDQAEIPTFQERGRPAAAVLALKRAEALRGLRLRVDGAAVALRLSSPGEISFPKGQGGLRTTRVELLLTARVRDPRQVTLSDATFGDRLGWRSIIPVAGEGTATRSNLPAERADRSPAQLPLVAARQPGRRALDHAQRRSGRRQPRGAAGRRRRCRDQRRRAGK